ncbi:MAG: beta-mannosidase [Bacteroidota bacterium]|nr:beta-mannosidase [Bacteroidota bacterium]
MLKLSVLFKVAFFLLITLFTGKGTSQTFQTADRKAINKAQLLAQHLSALSGHGILFGHQDDLAYGMGWAYEEGKSDVKKITGDYPALYGFDLGHLELNSTYNLDSVPFRKIREYIKRVYGKGGVITLSWHANNPFNKRSAWDIDSSTVASILPNGSNHYLFREWLHTIAIFLKSLKTGSGEVIPVLFRPYHECTGNWFWWGKSACTDEQFKELWKFTFRFLTQTEQVHNLLYVFNTADFSTAEDFERRYPGDAYVDVVSFDAYQNSALPDAKKAFIATTQQKLLLLTSFAKEHKKLSAIAEIGFENIPDTNWWTGTFYSIIKDYSINYILTWRNGGLKKATGKWQFQPSYSYFTPTKENASATDFIRFKNIEKIIFQQKLTALKIYQ